MTIYFLSCLGEAIKSFYSTSFQVTPKMHVAHAALDEDVEVWRFGKMGEQGFESVHHILEWTYKHAKYG